MNIDFKKFKKLECDDKCTTLQHEGGHTLKIAHKGLSEEHRKELDALPAQHLAKGGRAKFSQMYDPNIKGSKASKPSKSSTTMPGSPTESKNAYTEPGDSGTRTGAYIPGAPGPHEPDDISAGARNAYYGTHGKYPPCINSSCKSYGHPHPNCKCYGPSTEAGSFMAEGGEVSEEYYCDTNRPHKKDCEYFAGGGGPGLASEAVTEDPAAQSVEQWAPDKMGTDPVPQATPTSTQPPQYNMTDPNNMAQPVNPNPEMYSAANQAPPPPDEGSDVGKELKDAEDAAGPAPQEEPKTPVQTFQSHKDAAAQELYPEAQAFKADLDSGKITPQTYQSLFHDKGTLGKIGTIFGLLVGGAGAGLSHSPNALLQMMDQTIDRDLKAQQESVGNKQNFLKINQQNLMNKAGVAQINQDIATKAYALSKVQKNWAALHDLVTKTMNMPEGQQKQAAMQTLAMMNQGVQNENFSILDRAASASALAKTLTGENGTGNGQPNTTLMKSGLMGPEVKEVGSDIEQKRLPGIAEGMANRPIAENDRQFLSNKQTYDKAVQQYVDFANKYKNNWANLNPVDRATVYNRSKALTSDLRAKFLASKPGATVGELNALQDDNLIEPAAKWNSAFKGVPKVMQTMKDSQIEANTLAGGYGLKYVPGNRQDKQQEAPQSQGTKDKNGRPIHQNASGKWVYSK